MLITRSSQPQDKSGGEDVAKDGVQERLYQTKIMNTKPDPGINTSICPLCGEPNQCAMAADPDANECWCGDKIFPRELLAKIPPSAIRRTCVCAKCLENFLAEFDTSESLQ